MSCVAFAVCHLLCNLNLYVEAVRKFKFERNSFHLKILWEINLSDAKRAIGGFS